MRHFFWCAGIRICTWTFREFRRQNSWSIFHESKKSPTKSCGARTGPGPASPRSKGTSKSSTRCRSGRVPSGKSCMTTRRGYSPSKSLATMMTADQPMEKASRERLREVQWQKLQELLRVVSGRNRFYTRKWREAGVAAEEIKSLEDLRKLPFTHKADLVRAQEEAPPFGTNTTFPPEAYSRVHQTSGTTGAPLRVVDTTESWEWWGRCWEYVLRGAGVTAKDRIFLPFSFGPFIGFWAAVEGARQLGAMMIPGGGWDSLQRLHMMRDLGATVVCLTPTYALRLAEIAREQDFDLRALPVRALIHA